MEHPQGHAMSGSYVGLALELAVEFVIMYLAMYTMIATLDHFYLNINNVYMTLMMVAPMAVVMLVAMRSMYRSHRMNLAVLAVAALVAGAGHQRIGRGIEQRGSDGAHHLLQPVAEAGGEAAFEGGSRRQADPALVRLDGFHHHGLLEHALAFADEFGRPDGDDAAIRKLLQAGARLCRARFHGGRRAPSHGRFRAFLDRGRRLLPDGGCRLLVSRGRGALLDGGGAGLRPRQRNRLRLCCRCGGRQEHESGQ